MKILDKITQAAGNAVGLLEEKNRKAAYKSRLRTLIRSEESAAEKEYLALGRYFYHNLRNKGNDVTEAHCKALDEIETRLEKTLDQLEQCYPADDCAIDAAVTESMTEEVTLDDVECFDHDPEATGEVPFPEEAPAPEADDSIADENADLPFEG